MSACPQVECHALTLSATVPSKWVHASDYKTIPLCIFKHSGPSRPLRQLYQKPYSDVAEVVNLKCYLLNNLGRVVETTPTSHRFRGSRYTLATKTELWSDISLISRLCRKLGNFTCPVYTAYTAIIQTREVWLKLCWKVFLSNFERLKW